MWGEYFASSWFQATTSCVKKCHGNLVAKQDAKIPIENPIRQVAIKKV